MLFNSYIFMLAFLPLALAGYFICNKIGRYGWGKLWLIAMSLWFYAWFNPSYLPIILGSIVGNYAVYRVILRARAVEAAPGRRGLGFTALGVLANLGVLFYYKYFDFFLENLNAAFHQDFALHHILLPLGISFFTFQQIGFLVDTYRGGTKDYSFLDYALFVTFFPQLIAGPIVTHEEMLDQFGDVSRKGWDAKNACKGIYAFTCGLAKKVLVADIFGKAVSWGFGNLESMNGLASVWMMLSYMVQLYFDFSGYSDMARGLGFLFNIEIPVNFFSPYKAVHLVDFWKRWHITLNRFFTKYVYIPLGGNRKGPLRTYFNIFMIYLVSGIWHGAGWTYICWGALHGGVYVLTRRALSAVERLPRALTWLGTQVFFLFSLVFFRAESLSQALEVLRRMAGGGYAFFGIPAAFAGNFRTPEFFYLMKVLHLDRLGSGALSGGVLCDYVLMVLYMAAAWAILLLCKNVSEKLEETEGLFAVEGCAKGRLARVRPALATGMVAGLYLWSLVSFSEVSSFLYFNF